MYTGNKRNRRGRKHTAPQMHESAHTQWAFPDLLLKTTSPHRGRKRVRLILRDKFKDFFELKTTSPHRGQDMIHRIVLDQKQAYQKEFPYKRKSFLICLFIYSHLYEVNYLFMIYYI